MIDRLAEDHANARRLAEALSAMPGIISPGDIAQPGDGPLDPGRVRTNVVLFRVGRDRAAFIGAVNTTNDARPEDSGRAFRQAVQAAVRLLR